MNRMAPMCWSSKKLNRVTKSSLASKSLTFNKAAATGVSIAAMQQEVFRLRRSPEVLCKIDNVFLVETKVIKSCD